MADDTYDDEDDNVLTAEDIGSLDDLPAKRVEIPEWPKNGRPGVFYLRKMSASNSAKFTKMMSEEKTESNLDSEGMYKILVFTAVNKRTHGKPVFTMDHIEMLKQKDFTVLDRLQRIALAINGMTRESKDNAKKDSGEAVPDASPSDSPKN
jgi:hypothetical protein